MCRIEMYVNETEEFQCTVFENEPLKSSWGLHDSGYELLLVQSGNL